MAQIRTRTVRRELDASKLDARRVPFVPKGRAALDDARTELGLALAGLAEAELRDDVAESVADRLETLNWLLERALADWPR